MSKDVRHIVCITALLVGCVAVANTVQGQQRPYRLEVGLQAGIGYYVGDATPHIFNHVRETYGAHLRYKFDKRWALQVKGLHHRIAGPIIDLQTTQEGKREQVYVGDWQNKMINIDVMGEFNFFRFGFQEYDNRIKPISPYIFAGIGLSMYGLRYQTVGCYFPFGFGLKWKFAQRWGLNLAWQHNLYFADNLEGTEGSNNTWNLNGSNILNFDLTSQLTLGIVFEFAREKKICRHCMD